MTAYDYIFKLLLIGDSGVGKSSILARFVDDTFTDAFISTTGIDFGIRTVDVHGKTIKLQIWDSAGQERFRTVTSSYYRGSHGIAIVYSVSSRESFEHVPRWLQEIETYTNSEVDKVLLANQSDESSRAVSREEGQSLADSYSMSFFEVSAKTSSNIDTAFVELTSDIKERINPGPKLAVTLTGTRIANSTEITCFSVAGEELATIAVDSDDSMTWAKLRPLLLNALDRKGQRIRFISSSGSMLSLSDNEKWVTEIFELASGGKDDHSNELDRITQLFQGCDAELQQHDLSNVLHTLTGESLNRVQTEVKVLFEAFMRERDTNANTVPADMFLQWLFKVLL